MNTAKQDQFVSPADAFQRLKEGNKRFTADVKSINSITSQAIRQNLANITQRPFAIILCCSDSRAPAELIFDQGLGDLFVVRVAGNVISPALVGSIEFAASTFGTQLVVVMGHTGCGAIAATLEAARTKKRAPSENIQDIVQRILPQVEGLVRVKDATKESLMRQATKANIDSAVSHLKNESAILEDLAGQGKLRVIGAEYDLASGKVNFFEEVSPS